MRRRLFVGGLFCALVLVIGTGAAWFLARAAWDVAACMAATGAAGFAVGQRPPR